MAAAMRFTWRGAIVTERMRKAQMTGCARVADDCVNMAKSLVRVDTGALKASIKAHEPEAGSNGVSVMWGSLDNDLRYSFWQEVLGEPRATPYLRPSADACYPKLAFYIREDFA